MPSRGDLQIYQGDDYAAVVTVTDAHTNAPIDLTGCTAQAQIREGPADECPEVVVEIATAIVLPNIVTLAIPAAETVTLCGEYAWDLQVSGPDIILTTIMVGNANVTPEVTRPVTALAGVNHA